MSLPILYSKSLIKEVKQISPRLFEINLFRCQQTGKHEDEVGELEPHRLTRKTAGGKYCPNNILMVSNEVHKDFHANEFKNVKSK